jgi:hypothetical protein
MEAAGFSETSIHIYHTLQHQIQTYKNVIFAVRPVDCFDMCIAMLAAVFIGFRKSKPNDVSVP